MRSTAKSRVIVAATLACLLLAAGSVRAASAPLAEIEAKGAAPIIDTQVAQARERAIQDALRRAVESGAGVLLSSESRVRAGMLLSDKIYAKARGFVERYEVVDERRDRDEKMYHVTIIARVRKAQLAAKLVDVLVLDQQMGMPQLMVLVADDKGRYADPQSSGRALLVKALTERRFRLINPAVADKLQGDRTVLGEIDNKEYAAKLANEHAADLAVICTLNVKDKGTSRNLAQAQAVLRMTAINPTTGQEFVGNEVEMTGAGDTYDEAARAGARRVAREAGDYTVNQLALWWMQQAGPGAGREFIIELQNPGNILKVGRPFIQQVKNVQGVRQVKVESQSKQLIRLRLRYEGGGKDLLISGIAERCSEVPALDTLDLELDRGNQLVFSLIGTGRPRGSRRTGGGALPAPMAVVPFKNSTSFPGLDSTAKACTQRAESVCLASKKFRVVDRTRLDAVMREADLRDIGMLQGNEAVRLGKVLPAQMLMLGEIIGQKQTLRVNVRIIRTDNGLVLHTAEANVKVDDRDKLPDALEASLARAIDHERVRSYMNKLGLPRP